MLGTVRLKICISLLKLAPSNLLPNRYCLTLNIQKLADETAVVRNIQQGDLCQFCQFLWLNFPLLKVFQLGLDSDRLIGKGSKGQDMSWTASTLTVLFRTMFTASSSRPTFLPRVWMASWLYVLSIAKIPGPERKFECINSYGPKNPTPVIDIGTPKLNMSETSNTNVGILVMQKSSYITNL